MATKKLTSATVKSLGAKLDVLSAELTPDEAAVLVGLLGLATTALETAHDDVGDAVETTEVTRPRGAIPKPSDMLADSFRARVGERSRILNPGDEVSDSIGVGWLCVSWSKDYNIEALGVEEVRPQEITGLGIPGLRPGASRLGG